MLSFEGFEALTDSLEQVTVRKMVALLCEFSHSSALLVSLDFEFDSIEPKSASVSVLEADGEDVFQSLNFQSSFASILESNLSNTGDFQVDQEGHGGADGAGNVLENKKLLF